MKKNRLLLILVPLFFVTAGRAQDASEQKAFELYGFVMTDAGYNAKQIDPDWFDVVRPTKLPSFKGEFGSDGNAYFSVRQTRFGVKSYLPTALGELKTTFEFELFGTGVDAGQTTFRLRHAYAELGHFGVGQYWSPFHGCRCFSQYPGILGPYRHGIFQEYPDKVYADPGRHPADVCP